MTKHEIIIEIDTEGNIKGEVQGLPGPSCSAVSSWLDELGNVTEDKKTSDYFKGDGQHVSTKGG